MKRRSTDWKKVFASFISDKRLISKTYNTIQLSNKNKQTDWLKNGQKIWIDFFVKEDLQMANKYMKRSLTSLVIREMQNYNDVSPHPVRMSIINVATPSLLETEHPSVEQKKHPQTRYICLRTVILETTRCF